MARYTASPAVGLGGFDISEVDPDGMGRVVLFVSQRSATFKDAEDAVRFLILGLSLDGGLERAAELLRAERVRQTT